MFQSLRDRWETGNHWDDAARLRGATRRAVGAALWQAAFDIGVRLACSGPPEAVVAAIAPDLEFAAYSSHSNEVR